MVDIRSDSAERLFITLRPPRTHVEAEESAREMVEAVHRLHSPTVVLDVGELVVCPSILLGAMVAIGRRSRLRIVNASDALRSKFGTLGLDDLLSISA